MVDPSIGSISTKETIRKGQVEPDRAAEFRRIMGCLPTGVVVVAAMHDGMPYGMSVNSFASVSLDPLLVMFCAAQGSATWRRLRTVGRFTVSVLGVDQEETCRVFARKGIDRFAGLSWSRSPTGHPMLDDAIAWFDCTITDVLPAGDHEIALGKVLGMREGIGDPLVFHRGLFGGTSTPRNGSH